VQPLGLSAAQLAEYHRRLTSSHDESISVQVLDPNGALVGAASYEDGQINLQKQVGVRRDCQVTISDPNRVLGLESGAWEPTAANRLLRVTVGIECSWGIVTATPFTGPINSVGDQGGKLQLSAVDMTGLGLRGSKPMTFARGELAVDALTRLYTDALGYTSVRFPAGNTVRLAKPYSIGWADDAAPEVIAAQIVADLFPDWQLFKSGDGIPTLREKPTEPVLSLDVTTLPEGDADLSNIINTAVVPGKGGLVATLDPTHSWSPESLARNGVKRYLPSVLEAGAKDAEKRALAALTTASNTTLDLTFSSMPFWHLDDDDLIHWRTPDGDLVLPWSSGSLPLGPGGDASIGAPRLSSKAYGKPVITRSPKKRGKK